MIKKLLLLVMIIMMFTGCSKTFSYKYHEAESQNGDWSVGNGKIRIKEGGDLLKFKVTYLGDTRIDEGEPWNCRVVVYRKDTEPSYDTSTVIFTRMDIQGKGMAEGDVKIVDSDNDIFDLENDYDLSSVYLQIEYSKDNEVYEDIVELSLIE